MNTTKPMLFPPLYFHDLDFITKLNKSETMYCLIKVQQGWLGGWVVGWLGGWIDGVMDGRTDGRLFSENQ